MEAINYQFFNTQDGKPMPPVYTALVKPGESFFGNTNGVELRRCKEMIVREGELVMQPRRIRKRRDGGWEMAYGWPRGKSWSQGSLVAPIHVVEIITNNKNMDREMLKVIAVRYFEDRIKAAPDTLRFTCEDHGVREFKLEATLGARKFEIWMLPLHNRIQLAETIHDGQFDGVAELAGYNENLKNL